jgi:hypothetical protein
MKGKTLKTALPGSVTLPLEKENEMRMVSTVQNATMQDKMNRNAENKNIIYTTKCNRYMTEQPIISCIIPFS